MRPITELKLGPLCCSLWVRLFVTRKASVDFIKSIFQTVLSLFRWVAVFHDGVCVCVCVCVCMCVCVSVFTGQELWSGWWRCVHVILWKQISPVQYSRVRWPALHDATQLHRVHHSEWTQEWVCSWYSALYHHHQPKWNVLCEFDFTMGFVSVRDQTILESWK